MTQPKLHAWTDDGKPMRLVEQSVPKDDPDPKALACYGLLVSSPADPAALDEQIWLRFVAGRPISGVTTQFLDWCCSKLEQVGKTTLLMLWDNASWHISRMVRDWLRTHNRQVGREGKGVRIIPCYLPTKSPWLNSIESHWAHGKRKVVEPARLLTANELAERVCSHFGCQHEPHLHLTEQLS